MTTPWPYSKYLSLVLAQQTAPSELHCHRVRPLPHQTQRILIPPYPHPLPTSAGQSSRSRLLRCSRPSLWPQCTLPPYRPRTAPPRVSPVERMAQMLMRSLLCPLVSLLIPTPVPHSLSGSAGTEGEGGGLQIHTEDCPTPRKYPTWLSTS